MGDGVSRHRKFDVEFKRDAVRLVLEGGRSTKSVAGDLGIHPNVLNRWRREYEGDSGQAFPGKGHLSPEDEELRRLKRELTDVKEERDILKKALAIFSQRGK